ncbi:MAG: hypoxanthine phosphoribosyltransferase [Phycisphaerales bacterium JB039]
MEGDLERILLTADQLAGRVAELGEQIAGDLDSAGPGRIVLVPILTGSIVFAADLIRRMPLKLSLGVVAVSSYPGQTMTSKGAHLRGEIPQDLAGAHVLIVDDILDTGRTLALVRDIIAEQGPASLRICVLLRKEGRQQVDLEPEYVGFEIPDAFVVGYGLDYDGYYRNLPDIGVIAPPERSA